MILKEKFRLISLLLMMTSFIFSNAAASDEDSLKFTPEEKSFILNHRTLSVASNPDFAPFEYSIESKRGSPVYDGINVKILSRACSKVGISLEFIKTDSYADSVALIENGKVDILTGCIDEISLGQKIYITDDFFYLPVFLASLYGYSQEPQPGDTIGIVNYSQSMMRQIFRYFPPMTYNFKYSNNAIQVAHDLKKGRIKYAILSDLELSLLDNMPYHLIRPMNINHYINYGVNRNLGPEALSLLNKGLSQLTKTDYDSIIYEEITKEKSKIGKHNNDRLQHFESIFIILQVIIALIFISVICLVVLLHKKTRTILYDSITGLPTYTKFEKKVRKVLKNASPNEYAIFSFNIDNFRYINESVGVLKANEILAKIGNHFLKQCNENEFAVRFFADNFIMFAKNSEYFWHIEDRVYAMTTLPEDIKVLIPSGFVLSFYTSVYYIENTSMNVEEMIDKANLAKKLSKGNFSTHRVLEYTPEMKVKYEWQKEITLTMEEALLNREFEVYYQPKYSFDSTKIIGAEALIRWNNPRKGFLTPIDFVPIFEQNGFIQKIDKFVLTEIAKFLSAWNKKIIIDKCSPLTISFNLSRRQITNSNIIRQLKEIASNYDIGDNKIEVELTETIDYEDQRQMIKVMNEIKNAGFNVSVDGFGSGHSSLNMLKDMPADVIKLDRQLLTGIPENNKENIIIESIVEMAKKLSIKTVAEGVETKIQCDILKKVGCDIAQGFFYSHPVPEEKFKELLETSDEEIF